MKKIAIYTALFGDRDIILPPIGFEPKDGIDYFLFTDQKRINVAPYTTVYKASVFEDITRNARQLKLLGNTLLEPYEVLVWHDANIQLDLDYLPELLSYTKKSYLTTFIHPHRDDVYSEAMACVRVGKDKPLIIAKQLWHYFLKSVPAHNGMWSTGILIKNNLNYNSAVLPLWWEQLNTYSRRDQIGLAFVHYYLKLNISTINEDIFNSKYARYHLHRYQHYKDVNGKAYTYSQLGKQLVYFFVKLLRKLKKL